MPEMKKKYNIRYLWYLKHRARGRLNIRLAKHTDHVLNIRHFVSRHITLNEGNMKRQEIEENQSGVLYVVGTPIGNLGDITYRAIETLTSCDVIACEDTRVTRKLLAHYDISTPTVSHHQHSRNRDDEKILTLLREGKNVSLVTDAGTPGISDPGNRLVSRVLEEGFQVIPIPGLSAVATLISVSGIDMQKFSFLGFVPHKKGRQKFFENVIASEIPVMYYDSVHRVVKNLELLFEKAPDAHVIVGRELTKMFEEVVRGNVQEALEYFRNHPEKIKGEFTIVVKK